MSFGPDAYRREARTPGPGRRTVRSVYFLSWSSPKPRKARASPGAATATAAASAARASRRGTAGASLPARAAAQRFATTGLQTAEACGVRVGLHTVQWRGKGGHAGSRDRRRAPHELVRTEATRCARVSGAGQCGRRSQQKRLGHADSGHMLAAGTGPAAPEHPRALSQNTSRAKQTKACSALRCALITQRTEASVARPAAAAER